MQLVGQTCAGCERKIKVATKAAECPNCGGAFHQKCAVEKSPGERVCPGCKGDPSNPQAALSAGDAAQRRLLSGRGSLVLRILTTVSVGLTVLTVAVAERSITGASGLAINIGLWFFIWRGAAWARWTLGSLMAAGALFAVWIGVELPHYAAFEERVPFFLSGVFTLWMGGTLLFSPSIRAYFEDRADG